MKAHKTREVGRWRFIPRISYTNFRKEYSLPRRNLAFREWFSVKRYWGGRIINVCVRHFQLSFDFRKNWLADFVSA